MFVSIFLQHIVYQQKYCLPNILWQDYPSVGQLIKKARENNMNVIFVFRGVNNTNTRQGYYDGLARHFPGRIRNAFPLGFDSNDILSIIRDSYRVNGANYYISWLNLQMNNIAPKFIKI